MNNEPDYNDNLYFEKKMDCKNCPYTDEYCASGECTSQSPRNGSQKGDLTSQWKKGELNRNKIYYYETPFNTADTASGYWLCNHCDTEKDKIEILGEVPSYDEWKETYNCMLENEVLRLKNAQLKEQINKYCLDVINRGTANTVKAVKEFGMPERIEELVKQNAQLKELLKEWVQFEIEENPNDFTVMSERMSELANKTKEVLNEKV